jgi:hypothetical protein
VKYGNAVWKDCLREIVNKNPPRSGLLEPITPADLLTSIAELNVELTCSPRKEGMKKAEKTGFIPIGLEDYIQRHLKNNPGTSREEIESGLRSALADHKTGVKCDCGNPIWVIGSAVAGNACFHCITGEAVPDDDFEIDEAMR